MGVFVTNAESHIAVGVMRSLGRRGVSVDSGSFVRDAMGFHSRYCRRGFEYPNPRRDEAGFISRLEEILENGGYEALIPGDWDVLFPISNNREKLTSHTELAMPSKKVVEKANDKGKTFRAALENDIPCPKTYFSLDERILEEIREDISPPIVVKPCVGAGSMGLRFVDSVDKLREAYDRVVEAHGPAIIQEYVRGEKFLCSGLYNSDGEPRRVCVHKKIREYPITGGPTCAVETVENPDVKECAINLLKAIKWYGVASTDFIVDERDGVPKLLDLNPRLFGSLAVTTAAGVDYPYLLYRMIKEGDIEEDLNYRVGVKARSVLQGDVRHMLSVLKGAKSPQYRLGKAATLINFMKFWEYDSDYVIELNDLGPALFEIKATVKRKLGRRS